MDLNNKYMRLKDILKELQGSVVAFSGGVDSTFLLKMAIDVLGDGNVLAFIAKSPIHPARETKEAVMLASFVGASCVVTETDEMDDTRFIENGTSRCYFCKNRLLGAARAAAHEKGFINLLEGSNLDDMDDYRPGRKACLEQKIVSPLLLAELTKKEIRELSRRLGLPTHDKPAFACLATRVPYGTRINEEILRCIEQSEDYILSLGIRQVRVRYHGSMARIEIPEDDFGVALANRMEIADALQRFGFLYVALDMKGYRTGSMNAGHST